MSGGRPTDPLRLTPPCATPLTPTNPARAVIDTAIKTSEVGYIERQIVKVMENVRIATDSTVRDGAGRVLQFVYGDDGYDGSKVYRDGGVTLPFMPALLDKWRDLPPTVADPPAALPAPVRGWLSKAMVGWGGDREGLFGDILNRHETAKAPPGEMVGVLAAQSKYCAARRCPRRGLLSPRAQCCSQR